jgi:hypothetical protein
MNRKARRKEMQELNRQERRRKRELKRRIKEIDVKANNGYIDEQQALEFLEKLKLWRD